jgi:hypothetical protein
LAFADTAHIGRRFCCCKGSAYAGRKPPPEPASVYLRFEVHGEPGFISDIAGVPNSLPNSMRKWTPRQGISARIASGFNQSPAILTRLEPTARINK